MAIHNINMLQHQEDVKYLVGDIDSGENKTIHYPTDNTKDFYIQSLANMGQRVGIRNNGIKYGHITIKEIFSDVFNNTINNPIKIEYRKEIDTNNMVAHVSSTSTEDTISNPSSSNVKYKYYFTDNIEFSIPINNIAKYSKDSIIYNDGEYMIMCMYGQILGTSEDDLNNVELQYTKIDLKRNIIDSSIRAFKLSENEYAMLVMSKDETSDQNSSYSYILSLHIMNIDDLCNKIREEFMLDSSDPFIETIRTWVVNVFSFTACGTHDKDNPFNFRLLNKDITTLTLDEILEYDNNFTATLKNKISITIFSLIKHFDTYSNNIDTKLVFNTETDIQLSFSEDQLASENYETQRNLLINDIYGIDGRVVCLNNDLLHTYPNLLHIFSNNKYDKLSNIFVQIIYTLYEHLCDNFVDESELANSYPILFFPPDYVIEYMYNALTGNVYYTDNIFVTFINKEDYPDENNDVLANLNVPTLWYDGDAKVSSFKFVINYNDEFNDFINTISIHEEYTLPYINSLNNWQINDKDSNISAVGKNAGNPNIIIVKSTEQDYDILVGSNFDALNKCEWYKEDYKIDDDYYGCAYVPEVLASNIKYLDNSLILNIFTNENNVSYSSLWTLGINNYKYNNNVKDEIKFTYVAIDDNALDLSTLFNAPDTILRIVKNENLLNNNKFTDIIIQSYTRTIVNSSVDAQEYKNCHIHGELPTEDNDDNNSQTDSTKDSQYNNDTILKINYEKDSDYYLKSNSNYNEDFCLAYEDVYVNWYKTYKENIISDTEHYTILEESTEYSTNTNTFNNVNSNTSDIINVTEQTGETGNSKTEISEDNTTETSYIVEDIDNIPKEYIPSQNVPSLQLSEMIIQDANVLNRTNILTIGKDDINNNTNPKYKIYNSYIGSSFNDENKNVLHIGSCSYNINIGTNTLINPGYNQSFCVQDTLSLDFDNVKINSKTLNNLSFGVVSETIDDIIYNFVSPQVISKISDIPILFTSQVIDRTIYLCTPKDQTSDYGIKLDYINNIIFKKFARVTQQNDDILENFTGLFLNTLIKKYFNIDINDYINNGYNAYLNVKYNDIDCNLNLSNIELNVIDHIFTVKNSDQLYVFISINDDISENTIKYLNNNLCMLYYIIDKNLYIDINLKPFGYEDNKRFNMTRTDGYNSIDTNYIPQTPNMNNGYQNNYNDTQYTNNGATNIDSQVLDFTNVNVSQRN